jgi:hypothetical protein
VFPGLLAPVAKVVLGTASMLSLLLVAASAQDRNRRTIALAGLSMVLLLALARRASLAVALVWTLGVHVPIAVIHLFFLAHS